jgi:hypothetical protein
MAPGRKPPNQLPNAMGSRKSSKDLSPDTAAQNSSEDQPLDTTAIPKLQDPAKIQHPIQLAAQITCAVAGLATIVLKQRSLSTDEAFIVTVLALVALGPLFPALLNLPGKDRAPLILNIVRWICVVWIIGMVLHVIAPALTIPWFSSRQSTTEANLRTVGPKLGELQRVYHLLLHQPEKIMDLNRDAEKFAANIKMTNDEELGLTMQIYKYESLAYAYGMVAGSEMIAGSKFSQDSRLSAVEQLLDACNELSSRLTEAHRRQPVDEKLQKLRSWLLDDAADQRSLRMKAVGLCFRSQLQDRPEHRAADREEVKKIFEQIKKLDPNYIDKEHLESSYELAPCLNDK